MVVEDNQLQAPGRAGLIASRTLLVKPIWSSTRTDPGQDLRRQGSSEGEHLQPSRQQFPQLEWWMVRVYVARQAFLRDGRAPPQWQNGRGQVLRIEEREGRARAFQASDIRR